MPVGCANHYTASASCWSLKYRNNWSGLAFYTSAEFYSEMAQHSYSCRRVQRNVHGIYHSWLVFNFSSFPPRPMKIEVWPVFKLKISTSLHHYLDTICAPMSVWLRHVLYWSQNIEWSCTCFTRNITQMCIMWFILCELYYSRAPGWRLPLHAGSLGILYTVVMRSAWCDSKEI